MSEVDIVFTSVASIRPFCSETTLIFFLAGRELLLPYCVSLVQLSSRWPAFPWPRQSHSHGDGTQAGQGQKPPVTHPSGSLSTGVTDVMHLVFHPLAD